MQRDYSNSKASYINCPSGNSSIVGYYKRELVFVCGLPLQLLQTFNSTGTEVVLDS